MGEVQKKSILIVDDSASIRKEVKMILEKEGYSVREAGSEFGMFNSIAQYGELVDVILMDLTLNAECGLDLIAKIKGASRYKDIPVVMLTQHSNKESVEMAMLVGVQGYIVKPIEPRILIEKIKRVLDARG